MEVSKMRDSSTITRPRFFLCALLLLLFLLQRCCFSIGGDTLSMGQSLSGNQTLVSQGSIFELGFFTKGITSLNIYLGIWYIDYDDIVWVANREQKLSKPSSLILEFSRDGNLVLLTNFSRNQIWSTNFVSPKPNSTEAVLQDNGNFVVRDVINPSTIYWQSFDHPTDTLLPGAKLGIDKLTGKTQVLTSWKNDEDPTPGRYSFRIDPVERNQYFMEWNNSERYWSTEVWNGDGFSSFPEWRFTDEFNYSFISNEKESYLTYVPSNSSILARCLMDTYGRFKQLRVISIGAFADWETIWSEPRRYSQVYAFCGAFSIYREVPSNFFCECLPGFEPTTEVRAIEDKNVLDWSGGCVRKTPLQCQNGINGMTDGFLKISNITTLPANSKVVPDWSLERCISACMQNCSCTAYAYNSSWCLLWEGDLLNLQLSYGKQVLYLKLAASELPKSGVTLQDENILIYEYMANKSLDFFLFDPNRQGMLDWRTRIRIIEGIVQGLLYLHQYSRLCIIHRDLKASNILLDSEMNPKISDFGMARIFDGNESQVNTNRIVGTYGYMSPEYAIEGLFSIKSDVFSFGVLLLEIVSGKKNTGFYHTDSIHLLGYAWELWNAGRGMELMDPTLGNPSSTSTLLRYVNIGLLCVQKFANDRPTMSDVVSMLSHEYTPLPTPKEPAFSTCRPMENTNASLGNAENYSVNTVTISEIEAR